MRALVWFVLAVGWGLESLFSFSRHNTGHAALTLGIAILFAVAGWLVRRHDQRLLKNRRI